MHDRLNALIERAGRDPEIVRKIQQLGGTIATGPAAEFGEFMRRDVANWDGLIRESGAKID